MQFVLFTDNLADLSVRDACRAAKRAGFDGLDLTVRPGGHVLPKDVTTGLAQAQEIADSEGMTIPLISTNISAVDSPFAEEIITAAHYHIPNFKLGYWRYQPFGNLVAQLDQAKRKLEGIIQLCGRFHIRPCVHIHSGPILSNGPLLYLLLKDFSPADVGAYVDPMHMTLEGGLSGWEMALDLVAPWIALVGAKNFTLQPSGRDEHGQQRFEAEYVPLADGMAPLPQFFARLRQLHYDGVVSLHSEYKKRTSRRAAMTTPELLEQSAVDLKYLKSLLV
ncbi:MAG TPA: sugar phosphate isomerase/epimerase [Opitutaceae bacterium]|nr:sugar phosphate isomerase/epimerase [Opitutaceae bacterium]